MSKQEFQVDTDFQALVVADARGWPLPAMSWRAVHHLSLTGSLFAESTRRPDFVNVNGKVPLQFHLQGGIELPHADKRSIHWFVGNAALPLRPVWPGFAVNTSFYAAILWLLIPGPFVLRRLVRRRRGLCPKCAYPMGESEVCTECGNELPRGLTTDRE